MSNIKTSVLHMFEAIDEFKGDPTEYVRCSLSVDDNDYELKLWINHDTDRSQFKLLWEYEYRGANEGRTITSGVKRLEILDQMKALKEIGNTYVREYNEWVSKAGERELSVEDEA